MNLRILKARHKVRTIDGAEAVVLDETQDGLWIRVKYLSANDPSFVGAETLLGADEIEVLLGVAELPEWGNQVGVTLLLERGEGGHPDAYQVITMSGVPYGVTITAEDSGGKVEALERLVAGLKTFGFRGRVLIHDVTEVGSSEQYEVEV